MECIINLNTIFKLDLQSILGQNFNILILPDFSHHRRIQLFKRYCIHKTHYTCTPSLLPRQN